MLVGRLEEKTILQGLLQSQQAEFAVLYGRRRVGKTYLVREFFKDRIVFDFTGAYDTTTSIQLNNFHVELQRVYPDAASTSRPHNWSEAFHLLTDYLLSLEPTTEKKVVFIDELPWLDRTRAGFVSALAYFWNQHASRMRDLVLVTCGSAASWILQKILNDKGGLHNRVTRRIELKPFTLKETAEFCTAHNLQFTQYQITQLYMVLGGIPFYWQAVPSGKSVAQVVDQLCFGRNGLLAKEFNPLFQSLFKHAENHIQIVETLTDATYGLTRAQLIERTTIAGGTLNRVLNQLIDCGFVKALVPFGKKSRNAVFRIVDFYSIFYLKFIRGNVNDRMNTWQDISNGPMYYAWMGYAFENICLTHLPAIHRALGIHGIHTKVSSFLFKGDEALPGAQIDLIIDRNDGVVNLCEAKFTNTELVLTKEYVAKLRRKRSVFQVVTKTKKAVTTTLLSSYPPIRNAYYLEEIHSAVQLDDLFE